VTWDGPAAGDIPYFCAAELLANAAIAAQLVISPGAVEKHVAGIFGRRRRAGLGGPWAAR
jgi:hypothetical protein